MSLSFEIQNASSITLFNFKLKSFFLGTSTLQQLLLILVCSFLFLLFFFLVYSCTIFSYLFFFVFALTDSAFSIFILFNDYFLCYREIVRTKS